MKFNPFGAFISLGDNIHGLAHISQFASEKTMKEKLKPDTPYRFKILSLEPKEYRMSLKLVEEETQT